MKPRRWSQSSLHLCCELLLTGLKREQLLPHARRAQTVLDRFDDRPDLPIDTVEFFLLTGLVVFACRSQPVQLAMILSRKLLDEIWIHQMGLQSRNYASLR